MSRSITKPTKWPVRPAKTQINLGIRPVWSVFAVHMKNPGTFATKWVQSEYRSNLADVQDDLSLRWAHRSFSWLCHALAQIYFQIKTRIRNYFKMIGFWGRISYVYKGTWVFTFKILKYYPLFAATNQKGHIKPHVLQMSLYSHIASVL